MRYRKDLRINKIRSRVLLQLKMIINQLSTFLILIFMWLWKLNKNNKQRDKQIKISNHSKYWRIKPKIDPQNQESHQCKSKLRGAVGPLLLNILCMVYIRFLSQVLLWRETRATELLIQTTRPTMTHNLKIVKRGGRRKFRQGPNLIRGLDPIKSLKIPKRSVLLIKIIFKFNPNNSKK